MKEFCVDLEIARELRENEFPQKFLSFEYHVYQHTGGQDVYDLVYNGDGIMTTNDHVVEIIYAPTSDEILKELPSTLELDYLYFLTIYKYDLWFTVTYEANTDDKELIERSDKKLSNVLAKLWLHLKNEGYIK